jgi:chromosome segregation ATPase
MLTKIKNWLKALTTEKVKNIAQIVLIAIVIFSVLSLYNSCKQRIRDEERAKVAEEKAAALTIENNTLKADNAKKDTDIKDRTDKIAVLVKENLNLQDERDKIKNKYYNFKATFITLSQEGKDKELTALFHKNGIEMTVVQADDYIKIIPDERNKLFSFASDASECFELNQNLTKEKDNLSKGLTLCEATVVDLNGKIENNNKICENEKTIINDKLTNMTNQKKTWKRNAFWSKAAGIAATIFAILLVK